jgi:Methylase involved in ubiquinone/menaquinone biosynthesis
VTDQGERYDRTASGYARWWAPVLAPAVAELLDEVAGALTGRERLLDIGTGTGQLALGALLRWPAATVAGVDASAGMRALAEADADERLGPADRHRFETVTAQADAMPFDDRTFDAALSSFVLQLVPNRPAHCARRAASCGRAVCSGMSPGWTMPAGSCRTSSSTKRSRRLVSRPAAAMAGRGMCHR